MKKIIPLILLTLMTLISLNAQTTKGEELSKAEVFSSKSGTLIEKEFLEVGTIKKAEIKVIKYKDLISGENVSSIRIEYETGGNYSATKIASLDADEIDGLIKSIKIMQDQVFNSSPENYKEVTYQSRAGFEAGCYWSKGDWQTYLKLKKFDGKSYVFLKKEDFPTFLSLLEKSKTLL